MAELWVPQVDKHPDVSNLFDMMMVFQEQLDETQDRNAKIARARVALKSLKQAMDYLDEAEKQVSLATDFALFTSTEIPRGHIPVESVGMSGVIDDVHGISMGPDLSLSISLGVDAVTIFPLDNPTDMNYVMTSATTPIRSVRYIETIAS